MQFLPSSRGAHTWLTPAQTSFAHARHPTCGVSSPVRTGLYPHTHLSHSHCPSSFLGQAWEGTISLGTAAPELPDAGHMKISNPTEAAAAHLCQVPPCTRFEPAASAPQHQLWPGPLITMALLNLPPAPVLSTHQRDFLPPLGS